MEIGMSYLGGAKYHDVIVAAHPNGAPARFFVQPEIFGCPLETVKELVNQKQVTKIAINLAWQDDHVFKQTDLDAAVELFINKWVRYIKRNPQVTFYVSGATEHNLTTEQAQTLAARILAIAPVNVVYVNNPLPKFGGQLIKGKRIVNDVHGKDSVVKGDYIYDYDGLNMADDDIKARLTQHKAALLFFLWHPAFNGRLKTDDKTPRPERKSWPTAELICDLYDTIALARVPNQGRFTLPTGAIYKSHADRHVTPPESRAYKPVFLSQIQQDVVEMRTANGKLLATSSKRQPLDIAPNTSRHYFNESGVDLARKAEKLAGTPIVNLVVNGGIIGRINPALRAGKFR